MSSGAPGAPPVPPANPLATLRQATAGITAAIQTKNNNDGLFRRNLRERIGEINGRIAIIRDKITGLGTTIANLTRTIATQTSEIDRLNRELDNLRRGNGGPGPVDVADLQRQIAELTQGIEQANQVIIAATNGLQVANGEQDDLLAQLVALETNINAIHAALPNANNPAPAVVNLPIGPVRVADIPVPPPPEGGPGAGGPPAGGPPPGGQLSGGRRRKMKKTKKSRLKKAIKKSRRHR